MADSIQLRAALAAALLTCAAGAWAASTASSSASDAASSTASSASDSLKGSSNSSASRDNVQAGDYRIIAIAPAPERPDRVLLQLHSLADPGATGELSLYVPEPALAGVGLAAGGIVIARPRQYGIEFADGRTREAFFLVIDDDWYRELKSNPVSL